MIHFHTCMHMYTENSKMRHMASQQDGCHLFMHQHVFVSLLHMNVKSTWIMYLPRQCYCSFISHHCRVFSLPIYLFPHLRNMQTFDRISGFLDTLKLGISSIFSDFLLLMSLITFLSFFPFLSFYFRLMRSCLRSSIFRLTLAVVYALASSLTHYIDLWSDIHSDVFRETASGEGVAHRRTYGWW